MDNNLQPLYVSEAERQVMSAALSDFARTGQVTRDRAVDAGNHELAVSLTTQLEAAAAALVRLQSAAPKAEADDLGGSSCTAPRPGCWVDRLLRARCGRDRATPSSRRPKARNGRATVAAWPSRWWGTSKR